MASRLSSNRNVRKAVLLRLQICSKSIVVGYEKHTINSDMVVLCVVLFVGFLKDFFSTNLGRTCLLMVLGLFQRHTSTIGCSFLRSSSKKALNIGKQKR